MKLTVLGRHAPYPPAHGACNGYLVRSGDTAVLIDAGPGVAARLQEFVPIGALAAVVVSHLHDDHTSDVHCLPFGARRAVREGERSGPLPVYAPLKPAELRGRLTPAWPDAGELRELPVDGELRIGPLRFRFVPTAHSIPCFAIRVDELPGTTAVAEGGPAAAPASLFYSADTSRDGFGRLVPFAAGAGLAIVECSFPASGAADAARYGHCTSVDAATLGREAGVGRLLLTHFWPEADVTQLQREAAAVLPSAEAAEERRTYTPPARREV